MKLSATRLFPLLLVLALALLSFWLERTLRIEERHPALRRHDPDFQVEHFTLQKFDAAGALVASLAAAKMVHYPDDDSTELYAPRVVQTKPAAPRLAVSADRGALSQSGEEVFLYDNVLLQREAPGGLGETRIHTSFLHFVTAQSLVRTDRDVTVSAPGRSFSARGMEFHNDTGELFLRARVRGQFAARPHARSAP